MKATSHSKGVCGRACNKPRSARAFECRMVQRNQRGPKAIPTNWNVSVEIDAFRYPFTLYCSNSSTPHNGGSCFLGHRTPDLVINTASLDLAAVQADTTQLLQRIGHPVHRSPSLFDEAVARSGVCRVELVRVRASDARVVR